METSGGLQFLNQQEVLDKIGLTQGMKVACLGCGNLGYFILPAAKLIGKEGTAYAVDIQPAVLDSVKHKALLAGLTNLQVLRANLEKINSTPLPASSLDLAMLTNVLFQNQKRREIVSEAVRLLKPGGKLLVIDWKKIGVTFGPPVASRVEPQEIIGYATELNLRLILQTEFGKYFWGLIFEKS